MVQSRFIKACHHLLVPIVRMLIRNGVTWHDFSELCKRVYVDVARRDYGIQGRPTNSARVALLTGLSRREVGRLKNLLTTDEALESAADNRISQVLTGWHTDARFLGVDGKPLVLSEDGENPGINALLKRYAGDMPHGAVLKELLQLELVERVSGGLEVKARNYVRSAVDPNLFQQGSIAIHDHAETVAHNTYAERKDPVRFERMAHHPSVPESLIPQFHLFVEERGQAWLEEVDEWLATKTIESEERGKKTLRTGVGIYLIHDESQGIDHE